MCSQQLGERKEGGGTIVKNSIFEAIFHGFGKVSTTSFFFLAFSFCDNIWGLVRGIEITDAQVMRSEVIKQH